LTGAEDIVESIAGRVLSPRGLAPRARLAKELG
jgi:hypothetical protein